MCNALDSLVSLRGDTKSAIQQGFRSGHSADERSGFRHSSTGKLRLHAAMLSDRILYIDAEAIVLDKPAGLPVDAPRRGGDSIAAALA